MISASGTCMTISELFADWHHSKIDLGIVTIDCHQPSTPMRTAPAMMTSTITISAV